MSQDTSMEYLTQDEKRAILQRNPMWMSDMGIRLRTHRRDGM